MKRKQVQPVPTLRSLPFGNRLHPGPQKGFQWHIHLEAMNAVKRMMCLKCERAHNNHKRHHNCDDVTKQHGWQQDGSRNSTRSSRMCARKLSEQLYRIVPDARRQSRRASLRRDNHPDGSNSRSGAKETSSSAGQVTDEDTGRWRLVWTKGNYYQARLRWLGKRERSSGRGLAHNPLCQQLVAGQTCLREQRASRICLVRASNGTQREITSRRWVV